MRMCYSEGIYTIFENKGAFKSSIFNVNGYEIAVKGSLKVTGKLQGTEDLYRARVLQSVGVIEKKDVISPGPPLKYNLSQKGPIGSPVTGKIIGAPAFKLQNMLLLYSFVYLDKGLSSGIQVGNIYYIRANSREFKLPYEYDKPVVGKLKIVHVNSEAATAVIIAAREPVFVGDEFSHLSDVSSDLSQSDLIEEDEGELEEIEPDGDGMEDLPDESDEEDG